MSDKGILDYYKQTTEEETLSRERGEYELSTFLGGLHIVENKEGLKENEVVSVDGFISDKGLWTKDFALVSKEEQVLDNINLTLDTNLPVCTSSSENYTYEVWSVWIAYYEAYDPFTKNSDTRLYLSFAPSTITSIDAGDTKYVNILYNTGITSWYIGLDKLESGSITHKKVSETKSNYKASADAKGSFLVTVRDALSTITRTIAIGSAGWFVYNQTEDSWYKIIELGEGVLNPFNISDITVVSANLVPYTPTVNMSNELNFYGSHQYDAVFNSSIGVSTIDSITQIGEQQIPNGVYIGTQLSKINSKFVISILQDYIISNLIATGTYTYNNFYVKYPNIDLITVSTDLVFDVSTESIDGTDVACVSYTSTTNYVQIKRNWESGSIASYTYSGKLSGVTFSYTTLASFFTPTTVYSYAPRFGRVT